MKNFINTPQHDKNEEIILYLKKSFFFFFFRKSDYFSVIAPIVKTPLTGYQTN